MNNNIFLPKVIRVGYQNREDTYSGKLAYIIYIDEKNKVRKENSWESWRDDKIDPNDFKNEPTSGFVLNKKVGGQSWGWNPRQTYSRVYDPRGFEFEITIPNLLYILENCNSIKGKGLEGEFVYGWSGTELLLIPVDASDYKEHEAFSNGLFGNKIGTRDLIAGATYKFSNGNVYIYLGRFPEYENNGFLEGTLKSKNNFYFFDASQLEDMKSNRKITWAINTHKSLPKIAQCLDEDTHSDYAYMMDLLGEDYRYMPPDVYEIEKTSYTFEEFKQFIIDNILKRENHYYGIPFISGQYDKVKEEKISIRNIYGYNRTNMNKEDIEKVIDSIAFIVGYGYGSDVMGLSLKAVFNIFKPLKIGKIKKKIKKEGVLQNA